MSGILHAAGSGRKRLVYIKTPDLHETISATGTPTAAFRFATDGYMYVWESTSAFPQLYDDQQYQWLLEGVNSDYWIRATSTGPDTIGSGILNTWEILSTNRSWGMQTGVAGTEYTDTLIMEIATDSGGANIVATGYVTVHVQKTV